MKIKVHLSIGLVGCHRDDILEMPDDVTDDEIQEEFESWIWENVNTGWEKERVPA